MMYVTDLLPKYLYRYHAGGPMSVRGFDGYGIGPRAPLPPSNQLEDNSNEKGDSLGAFSKALFLGTVSVPLNTKVCPSMSAYLISVSAS